MYACARVCMCTCVEDWACGIMLTVLFRFIEGSKLLDEPVSFLR